MMYNEYNRIYFNKELHSHPIQWSKELPDDELGRTTTVWDNITSKTVPKILLNDIKLHNQELWLLHTTLLHEMIHVLQFNKGRLTGSSPQHHHGEFFNR